MKSMKINFERTIGPIAVIVISIFMLGLDISHFITRRNTYYEYFDQIYRWELSTIIPILLFLTIGVGFFIEVRGKEQIAHIMTTTSSTILLLAGTFMYFAFDNIDNAGAFSDALIMVGLPMFLLAVSVFRLRNHGKDVLTDKMRNILLTILTVLIAVAAIVAVVVVIDIIRG